MLVVRITGVTPADIQTSTLVTAVVDAVGTISGTDGLVTSSNVQLMDVREGSAIVTYGVEANARSVRRLTCALLELSASNALLDELQQLEAETFNASTLTRSTMLPCQLCDTSICGPTTTTTTTPMGRLNTIDPEAARGNGESDKSADAATSVGVPIGVVLAVLLLILLIALFVRRRRAPEQPSGVPTPVLTSGNGAALAYSNPLFADDSGDEESQTGVVTPPKEQRTLNNGAYVTMPGAGSRQLNNGAYDTVSPRGAPISNNMYQTVVGSADPESGYMHVEGVDGPDYDTIDFDHASSEPNASGYLQVDAHHGGEASA